MDTILRAMRRPVYCYKYMARRHKFHRVLFFLPKEASRTHIHVCWGTTRLAEKKHKETHINVANSTSVSMYQWDVNRSMDIDSFEIGLSQANAEI